MNKMQEQLLEFHRQFDAKISDSPCFPAEHKGHDVMTLRKELMREELAEFVEAHERGDLVNAIDGLMDLLYVTVGTCVSMGVDIEAFFNEVHRSNMSKVWDDGTVHYREDGKVIKPETYSPANIEGILQRFLIPA